MTTPMENKREFDSMKALKAIEKWCRTHSVDDGANLELIDDDFRIGAALYLAGWQFDQDTKALEMKDADLGAANLRIKILQEGYRQHESEIAEMKRVLEIKEARIKELEEDLRESDNAITDHVRQHRKYTDQLSVMKSALEEIASVEKGISGRNAGRNTFRSIAIEALAQCGEGK